MNPIPFGSTPDGRAAMLYRLCNASGMTADVTNLGACLVSLRVPDGRGTFVDVVLGFDGAEGYATNPLNLGATVGRHANRIGGASFELGGTRYDLPANEKGNSLHSGPDMWFTRIWEVVAADDAHVELRLQSPDGDQGYPGAVDVRVTYELTNDALVITYDGTADAPTVINLTNHSYFNLNGHASGCALDHTLRVDAAEYTPSDDTLVPTGEIASVEGTPLDLREAKTLRPGVESDFAPIVGAKGYDHNYVLLDAGAGEDGFVGGMRTVATLRGDKSGIQMDVVTDTPGMQVYSGNFIGCTGKGGCTYHDYDAICLETQFFPDAIHHQNFPQPVFGPERPYRSRTAYVFRTE